MSAESTKEAINKAIDNMGDDHPPEVKEQVRKLSQEIWMENKKPYQAMGLSGNMMEGMYGLAYRLYSLGKYDEAVQMFRLLIIMNPMEPKYLLGVAACYHMMKQYDQASSSYMLCSIVNPLDPVPYFHASDCFLELGKLPMAKTSLELCIKRCEGNSDFDLIKNRAEVALQGIVERLPKQKVEKSPLKKAS